MAREDAPAVAAIAAAGGLAIAEADVVRRLGRLEREPGHAAFVAEDGGSVVGWAHVHGVLGLASEGCAEIRALAERQPPAAGAAEALLRACGAWASDAGFARLRLPSGEERALDADAAPAPANRAARPAADIGPLQPGDRAPWEVLARGYKHFYETRLADEAYEAAWRRIREGRVQALGARIDGRLVGIAHFLYHGGTWQDRVCYLQDLFVDPAARGHGVARALIEAVAGRAREAGAERYYWLTQRHNLVARALYDRVAAHRGFIRYDYPVAP